jgi:hypothetical protein
MPMVKLFLSPSEVEVLEELSPALEAGELELDELSPQAEGLIRHLLKEALMWMED